MGFHVARAARAILEAQIGGSSFLCNSSNTSVLPAHSLDRAQLLAFSSN
jgi:hypothetical protein